MTIKTTVDTRELPTSGNVTENEPRISNSEMRQHRIAEIAYFMAKKRGFKAGHEVKDWLEAESEVVMSEAID